MIELKNDSLVFSFPEVHQDAIITINFQRTLRIPDDKNTYPLPPGLGEFPLKHVDDHAVPKSWIEHGGVMLPMYQSEALWVNIKSNYIYDRETSYPFAIKVATGKINAITGKAWENELNTDPQDYMISTEQPWLDGYCVEKDIIRQFVAMPTGSGYSVEEQLTGEAKHGGLQLVVYPMKRSIFEDRFPKIVREPKVCEIDRPTFCKTAPMFSVSMDFAPGGKMHQEIYEDPFDFSDWDQNTKSRCFVHITNSIAWKEITGENPPTKPFRAKDYNRYGLPWFKYYREDSKSISGSKILSKLKSIVQKGNDKGETPIQDNDEIIPKNIKNLSNNQVREGQF